MIHSPLRTARLFNPNWFTLNSANELSFNVSSDVDLFRWPVDLRNVGHIHLRTVGRKNADASTDNYLKVYIDDALKTQTGWTDAVEDTYGFSGTNTVSGIKEIRITLSGGADLQLLKTCMLWGTK